MSTCDPVKGCPPDTHNLHCGYPNCAKGNAERKRRACTRTIKAALAAQETT